jgi:hypothetical protein
MDLLQFGGWLLVMVGLIAFIVLGNRSVRRFLSPSIIRFGSWAVARLSPAVELDQDADDLSKVLRREQLCAEVERLRRIVATDRSMSATRQIANRLAYRQLLRDLENTPTVDGGIPGYGAGWKQSALRASAQPAQRAPTVEILEIGRRRRTSAWLH